MQQASFFFNDNEIAVAVQNPAPQPPLPLPTESTQPFRPTGPTRPLDGKPHHTAAILADAGRESNKELGFRHYAASKHCQYFTPLAFSKALHRLASDWLGHPRVFDPTCGTGRLLYPWRQAGCDVRGIELDRDTGQKARQLLGAASIRYGDVLDYLPHAADVAYCVVTNPPFGLHWNIEDRADDFHFAKIRDGKRSISSELATLECCFKAVQGQHRNQDGVIFALLPVGFAASEQYRTALREASGAILLDVGIDNLFHDEYRLDVKVRLHVVRVVQRYRYEHHAPTIEEELDYRASEWERRLGEIWDRVEWPAIEKDALAASRDLPDLDRLVALPRDYHLALTARGPTGSACATAMTAWLDETSTQYDPVRGIESGAVSAIASRVALLARGTAPALAYLRAIGFDVAAPSERETARLERLRNRYDYLSTPLMKPLAHDRLAYYLDRPYRAVRDYRVGNITVWRKDRAYQFRPGWIRKDREIKREEHETPKGKKLRILRRESGFLRIRIDSEAGPVAIDETDTPAVRLLINTFGLPEIQDVKERFPAIVGAFQKRAEKVCPYLYDFQREDAARLATKPSSYLGYDMGGGKTVASAAWAVLRQYRRVLVVCESGHVDNWRNELHKKFGLRCVELRSHAAIANLRADIAATKKSRTKAQDSTTFYLTSYEFLSLGDRVYDPWDCCREQEGREKHDIKAIRSHACPDCGHDYLTENPACPKCGEKKGWSGVCRACGYRAFTYGRSNTVMGVDEKGEPVYATGNRSFPAIRYLRKLFGAVLVDEAQAIKSKLSLRGQAVRSIRAKGRMVLTGTLMRGFVTDIYWTLGWLLGHDTPGFPYPYRAGSRRFLDEFATYDFVDEVFRDTLQKGRAKLIPEVSNLNRLRRLLAPMTIRRLKRDMPELKALPPKHRHIEYLPMDAAHQAIYDEVSRVAEEAITKEFRTASQQGRDINMGIISRGLWALQFAATVPTSDHIRNADPLPAGTSYAKLRRVEEIVGSARAAHDKVLVFSGLRDSQKAIADHLTRAGHRVTAIFSDVSSQKRLAMIQAFEADPFATVIVTGLEVLNKCFTITGANHVVITDIQYTPEPHHQAEDRVHRPGQSKDVHIHYLFSRGTIEEKIYAVTEAKQRAIDTAIDGVSDTKTAQLLRESAGNAKLAVAIMILDGWKQEEIKSVA